ncbi:hypothetical protein AGMMS49921_12590 [Endomicrobiia bacterium]|nr:hypothetical protein AGMMS49921_12590 [Endomicrobiia bacterium]
MAGKGGGHNEWPGTADGRAGLKELGGHEWLETDDGEAWQRTDDGKAWLHRQQEFADKSGDNRSKNKILEEELLKNKKVREILDKTWKTTLRELTKDNLDKAYRALSKKYLPDKHNNESNEEKERAAVDFKELKIMLIRC